MSLIIRRVVSTSLARFVASLACLAASAAMCQRGVEQKLAIRGATVIDVSQFGSSTQDVSDSVVLVNNGKIAAVGTAQQLSIPAGYEVLDATGMYLIPGLIDGFGAIRTQGFADAYLENGVTTVYVQVSPEGEDGETHIYHASPGPDVIRGGMIGGYSADGMPSHQHPWTTERLTETRLPKDVIASRIGSLASDRARGVFVGLDVWPDQLDTILNAAQSHGMATLGEMAFTTYPYAVRAGVNALLRSDRYQMAVDLPETFLLYSDDPEGPGGAPGYHGVCAAALDSPLLQTFGAQLKASRTMLMPMLSIEANADNLDVPNPWSDPAARYVKASDLDDPVDAQTGGRPYLSKHTPEAQAALRRCAFHREDIDASLYKLGAHSLAGSSTPAFGNLPGAGLHLEISLLHRIGLTPREALAAATSNFSTAFGWNDRGEIQRGRRADLVILTRDPRTDVSALRHIRTVIQNGQIVFDSELAKRNGRKVQ